MSHFYKVDSCEQRDPDALTGCQSRSKCWSCHRCYACQCTCPRCAVPGRGRPAQRDGPYCTSSHEDLLELG